MLDIEEGDNIISCDIDAARQRLLENTWIKDVSIARRFFPAALTVNLREYNPMAAIFIDGKGYVINEEGRIFASMPKGYKGMIMQTEGFVPTGEKMNEIIKKGVSAIRAMRSKGLTVDGMVIQPSGRTTYNLKNGVSIAAIGSLTPAKLDAAMAVIKQIKPAKGSILDLSYEDKIVLSAPPNNKGGLVTRGG